MNKLGLLTALSIYATNWEADGIYQNVTTAPKANRFGRTGCRTRLTKKKSTHAMRVKNRKAQKIARNQHVRTK